MMQSKKNYKKYIGFILINKIYNTLITIIQLIIFTLCNLLYNLVYILMAVPKLLTIFIDSLKIEISRDKTIEIFKSLISSCLQLIELVISIPKNSITILNCY